MGCRQGAKQIARAAGAGMSDDALRFPHAPTFSLPVQTGVDARLAAKGRRRGGEGTLAAARLFTLLLGLAAIAWGAATFPTFWRQSTLERTAVHIVERDAFKPEALAPLLPAVAQAEESAWCRPAAVRAAALVRLRLAEDAMAAGERDVLDDRLAALDGAIRGSLACAPADPFLWMVFAWLDGARNGFDPRQIEALRLSYRLGANEGWVAARRNRYALSMFARLPPDLADAAVAEFARMVDSWIYGESIAEFVGPGWPVRDRLLTSLSGVGQLQREAFAKALYAQGLDVAVPGVAPRDPRPWY